jgi:hypothetical protein
MTALESLNLSYLLGVDSSRQITDDSAVALARALVPPHLTRLVLHNCANLSDVGVGALLGQCTTLRVVHLHGVRSITGTVTTLSLSLSSFDAADASMRRRRQMPSCRCCSASPASKTFDSIVTCTSPVKPFETFNSGSQLTVPLHIGRDY